MRIENNEDELEKAVRQYNETMGVDYLLLPKENRSFESTILFLQARHLLPLCGGE